jgi:membrane dipeptidase
MHSNKRPHGTVGLKRDAAESRRGDASAGWLAITALLLPMLGLAQPNSINDQRVADVHAAAMPLDAHVDVLVPTTPDIYRTDDGVSQVTVDKLLAGGMVTITLALQSPTGPDTPEGIAFARSEVDAKLVRVRGLADAFPGSLEIAYATADVERIHAAGKIAVLIGFQNAYALGSDLSLFDHYVEQGVRVFAFNHAGNNAFSDSSRPAVPGDAPHGGLSELGRAAIRLLNDRGVVIDVSQLTPDAVMDVLELSRAPVIASHSAVRALIDETRNLRDDEMEAIALAGGVVHLPPFNTYLAPRPPEFVERLGAIRQSYGLPARFRGVLDDAEALAGEARGAYVAEALAAVPRATIDDYVDHIDHAVQLIGVDHVGIGTDFDHGAGIVGYRDASESQNLTRSLLERGYTADEIARIWSGNFMRVFRDVEAAARSAGNP